MRSTSYLNAPRSAPSTRYIKTKAGTFTNLPAAARWSPQTVGCGHFDGNPSSTSPPATHRGHISIQSPDSQLSVPLSRRSLLLGLAACSVSAPAVVRASALMPIRRIVIPEVNRPWAGYVERLFYNALAANLRRGRITVSMNGTIPTLCEAERLVSKARQNGWIHDQPCISDHLPVEDDSRR
jgi:hypothetical protein